MRSAAITALASTLALCSLSAAAAGEVSLTAELVRKGGGPLSDAVVELLPADGSSSVGTAKTAHIDQVDMEFVPLVTAVQVGTVVDFPNSDKTRHQVYSFSQPKTFTLKLYANRPAAPVKFDAPGTVVLGCNIHDRMMGWVRVVASPWFSVSDSRGQARIESLPPGDYRLRIWHPSMTVEPAVETVRAVAGAPLKVVRTIEATPIDALRGPG